MKKKEILSNFSSSTIHHFKERRKKEKTQEIENSELNLYYI